MDYGKQAFGNQINKMSGNNIGNSGFPAVNQLPGRRLPEKKFRAGGIAISIWQNIGRNKNGEERIYRTISLERSYKDKTGIWRNSSSLSINDIPKAVLLLNKAYEYVVLKQNMYEIGNPTPNIIRETIQEEEIVI